jgi:hypothetical protein
MTTELIVGESYMPYDREASGSIIVLRYIGKTHLFCEHMNGEGSTWIKESFLNNCKRVPKPKTKLSRYQFTDIRTGHTWQGSTFLTEEGRHYKDSTVSEYFSPNNYKHVKIGEEIDCPWEE